MKIEVLVPLNLIIFFFEKVFEKRKTMCENGGPDNKTEEKTFAYCIDEDIVDKLVAGFAIREPIKVYKYCRETSEEKKENPADITKNKENRKSENKKITFEDEIMSDSGRAENVYQRDARRRNSNKNNSRIRSKSEPRQSNKYSLTNCKNKNGDNIPVEVSGTDIPKEVTSFENSGLERKLTEKFSIPTQFQKYAIPIILSGRDLVACTQTGSGKIASFLLPITHNLLASNKSRIIKQPRVLILVPTKERSQQIYNEFRKIPHDRLKCYYVFGNPNLKLQEKIFLEGCDILIGTIERIEYFLTNKILSLKRIEVVVLDEINVMLGCLPLIEKIMLDQEMPKADKKQVLMYSRNLSPEIQQLAKQFLNNHIVLTIDESRRMLKDVEQTFFKVCDSKKGDKLIEVLKKETSGSHGTIVFVDTILTAQCLTKFLLKSELSTISIHDCSESNIELALEDLKSVELSVLIVSSAKATHLAHHSDIKAGHVIHYDLPKAIYDYVLTFDYARKITSFFDPKRDAEIARSLVRILKRTNNSIPPFLIDDTY